jgi:hypothetical protein
MDAVDVAEHKREPPPPRRGKGCLIVALVAIPMLIAALPLVSVLVSRLTTPARQAPGPGVVTTPARPTPTPPPRVTGHVTLSGSVSETLDTPMSFFTANGGTSCNSQARGFTGLYFFYRSPDGSTSLTVSVYAPQGSAGPGTYQTSNVTVAYALTTGAGQEWGSQRGQTTGTLVVKPDGSGTLSVTGLRPQGAGTQTFRRPLVVSVSFSCG